VPSAFAAHTCASSYSRQVFTVKRDLNDLCTFHAELTSLLKGLALLYDSDLEVLPPPFPDTYFIGAAEESLLSRSQSRSQSRPQPQVQQSPGGSKAPNSFFRTDSRKKSTWTDYFAFSSLTRRSDYARHSPQSPSQSLYTLRSRSATDQLTSPATVNYRRSGTVPIPIPTSASAAASVPTTPPPTQLLDAVLSSIEQYLRSVFALLEEIDDVATDGYENDEYQQRRDHIKLTTNASTAGNGNEEGKGKGKFSTDNGSASGCSNNCERNGRLQLQSELGRLIGTKFLTTGLEEIVSHSQPQPQPQPQPQRQIRPSLSSPSTPPLASQSQPQSSSRSRPCWYRYASGGLRLRLSLNDDFGGRLSLKSEDEMLRSQKSRCIGCGEVLSSGFLGFDKNYQPCRYVGGLFCRKWCHFDDRRQIPHRMLLYWDHVPHRVCRQAADFLDAIWRKPILHIGAINPLLYEGTPPLRICRGMRNRVSKMIVHFLMVHPQGHPHPGGHGHGHDHGLPHTHNATPRAGREVDVEGSSKRTPQQGKENNIDEAANFSVGRVQVQGAISSTVGPDRAHLCAAGMCDVYSLHDLVGVHTGEVLASLEALVKALTERDAVEDRIGDRDRQRQNRG
jgi:Putative zinc-RING and/or ribbon